MARCLSVLDEKQSEQLVSNSGSPLLLVLPLVVVVDYVELFLSSLLSSSPPACSQQITPRLPRELVKA